MKKWHLALLLVLLMPISYSATQYVQDYNNFLTRSIADNIYYQDGDNGTFSNLIVGNLSVWDSYFNVSVVNFNVTGDINMSGCVNFPDGSSICNLTYFNDTFLRNDGDYANGTYEWNWSWFGSGVNSRDTYIRDTDITYRIDNIVPAGTDQLYIDNIDLWYNSSKAFAFGGDVIGRQLTIHELDFFLVAPTIRFQKDTVTYNKEFGIGNGLDGTGWHQIKVDNELEGGTYSNVAISSLATGNTTGDIFGSSFVGQNTGTGGAFGFRGYAQNNAGTGDLVGVDAYLDADTNIGYMYGVRSLGVFFGAGSRNRTFGFYSGFGHSQFNEGSLWVCDQCQNINNSNPSDYLDTNGDGQGFFDSDIESKGNVFVNNIYGSLWNRTSGGWNLDLSAIGVYQNISNLTAGELNGITAEENEAGIDHLRTVYNGTYKIETHLSFHGGSNSEYGFGVAINWGSTPERNCYVQRSTSSSALGVIATTCLLYLDAGDNISLLIEDEANPLADPDIHTLGLTVLRVGNG